MPSKPEMPTNSQISNFHGKRTDYGDVMLAEIENDRDLSRLRGSFLRRSRAFPLTYEDRHLHRARLRRRLACYCTIGVGASTRIPAHLRGRLHREQFRPSQDCVPFALLTLALAIHAYSRALTRLSPVLCSTSSQAPGPSAQLMLALAIPEIGSAWSGVCSSMKLPARQSRQSSDVGASLLPRLLSGLAVVLERL